MSMNNFFKKMHGVTKSPPSVSWAEIMWSWIGSFFGILMIAFIGSLAGLVGNDAIFLIGSFGASAVLIYGTPTAPFAQPRNLVGGHIISAIVGVLCFKMLPDLLWLAAALAVACAIALMHVTKTIHPPGGASALIAVVGSGTIHDLGFLYVLTPVAAGAVIMLIVALIVNNLAPARRYPQFWI